MIIMNQKAIYEQAGTPDNCGKYSYTRSSIDCRIEMKHQLFIDYLGRNIVSKAIVYTLTPISIEDRIEWNGKSFTMGLVEDIVNVFGIFQYYKVLLK